MKRALACVGLLVALTIGSERARAQSPGDNEVDCDYWSTLSFDLGSAVVNLDSQAELNRALQWLFDAPSRYLNVVGADGPSPSDARIGRVRVNAVTGFLISNGAAASAIIRGDFSELRASRLDAGLRPSNVVLMGCEVAPLTD
jgi:hypothetical protein